MPTCSTCNYESPGSAKFCRQCGAPLFAENDLSGASTRNYGRQEPAPAVAISAPLPPSVADVVGADTARHYQPPQAFVQPVSNTAPINTGGSKLKSWQMVAVVFLILFIGLGLGRFFAPPRSFDRTPAPVSPEDAIRLELEVQQHAQRQMMAERIREAQDRAREMQDRIREAQERARELAERAAAEGALIPTGDMQPLDLDQYEYPGAKVGNYSRIPSHEMLQMRTKDSFDTIKGVYQSKLGKPLLYINDGDGDDDKKLFFQSNTAPAVFVTVEHDDESGGWLITITRAPFQFALPDAPKAANGAAKQ